MKNKLHLFLFAVVALITGCEPDIQEWQPTHISTYFEYEVNGMTVTFYNRSSSAMSVKSWSFGDGTTSTVENPTHTYSENGIYNVVLTCTYKNKDYTYSRKVVIKSYTKILLYGIEYVDVDVYLDFYKARLFDDKSNTIFYTNYTSDFLYGDKLPYTYTFNRQFEIDFSNHDYYVLYIYHSAWNDGTTDDIQCLKQNIQASEFRNALKTAAPYIEVHNNSGMTIVRLLCMYL